MEHKAVCRCGKREASFQFKDEIMPPETIKALYCPECSHGVAFDTICMISDNGWVIKYDMDVIKVYRHRLPSSVMENLLPETLFDTGYATWRGIYPGDHIDSAREKQELVKLAKEDPHRYFKEIKSWALNRMLRLKLEGWRKAYERKAA
jgi:hypothetical protein